MAVLASTIGEIMLPVSRPIKGLAHYAATSQVREVTTVEHFASSAKGAYILPQVRNLQARILPDGGWYLSWDPSPMPGYPSYHIFSENSMPFQTMDLGATVPAAAPGVSVLWFVQTVVGNQKSLPVGVSLTVPVEDVSLDTGQVIIPAPSISDEEDPDALDTDFSDSVIAEEEVESELFEKSNLFENVDDEKLDEETSSYAELFRG